jgi:hypothetical protein
MVCKTPVREIKAYRLWSDNLKGRVFFRDLGIGGKKLFR